MTDEREDKAPDVLPGMPEGFYESPMGRYMNSSVHNADAAEEPETQIGAVIVFKRGVTEGEAREQLERISGTLDTAHTRVQEFYPLYGYPMFYVP